MMELSHIDGSGKARMVDISDKERVKRAATARGKISLQSETLRLIKEGLVKKGLLQMCVEQEFRSLQDQYPRCIFCFALLTKATHRGFES